MENTIQPAARQIRSYHRAFHFELTLYSLGNMRLAKPIPARFILYLAVLEAVMVIAGRTPLVRGSMGGANGALFLYGAVPLTLGWLLTVAKIEGRRFHVALRMWCRHWLAPKLLAGGYRPVRRPGERWRPADIVFISDGRCGTAPEGLLLRGPGKVGLRYPSEGLQQGRVLSVRQLSQTPCREPKLLSIADGASVRFLGTKGAAR